jgi:CRISPR/Cas system-associated protein Cas5 (RAMP superfamily)
MGALMSSEGLEVPDYEQITSLEEADEEIAKHKANLVGKDILESKMKADKKEYVSAINTQLKELAEEREHEINVINALEQHKQYLANGGGKVIPMPPKVVSSN